MNNWTEYNIGIIYFAGLFIALFISILIIIYLRPIKSIMSKITNKFHILWNHSFKVTILLAGLLGAMSVSFKSCQEYDYLLESKYKTVMKGIDQVSTSFNYLVLILGIWFLFFLVLRLILKKKNSLPST
jgi:hypothetical protein